VHRNPTIGDLQVTAAWCVNLSTTIFGVALSRWSFEGRSCFHASSRGSCDQTGTISAELVGAFVRCDATVEIPKGVGA